MIWRRSGVASPTPERYINHAPTDKKAVLLSISIHEGVWPALIPRSSSAEIYGSIRPGDGEQPASKKAACLSVADLCIFR